MARSAYADISFRTTPVREQADDRQVRNSDGGYVLQVGDLDRLARFLITGTEGGTFYIDQKTLTLDNAKVVRDLARTEPMRAVDLIVTISTSGRAHKNTPALFALAVISAEADLDGRRYALAHLNQVARTGTHLFEFVGFLKQFRGWGRAAKRAVAGWYTDKDGDALAYQVAKYGRRDGWAHSDVIRLAHPKGHGTEVDQVIRWALGMPVDDREPVPALIDTLMQVDVAGTEGRLVDVIRRAEGRMSWEMLPPWAQDSPNAWGALIDMGMPVTATMRNLPRLTRYGLLTGDRLKDVSTLLTNPVKVHQSRVHPLSVLSALRTYQAGHSTRGSSTWKPITKVVDALDEMFYLSFGNVDPVGGTGLMAIDVSASMTWAEVLPGLSPRAVSAAMALVTASVEDDVEIIGVDHTVRPLTISKRQRLDDVIRMIDGLVGGATNMSLPYLYAANEKRDTDWFMTWTDNEVNRGPVHAHQALGSFRSHHNPDARAAVAATTATSYSIMSPDDDKAMDIAGFDAAVPQIAGAFLRG